MSVELEVLELATMLPGGVLVEEENVEDVWKSTIRAESGDTIAYVKIAKQNQIVSEITCALTGRSLGLQIPKAYLVRIREGLIGNQNEIFGFGSQDADAVSFKRWTTINRVLADALFEQWKLMEDIAVFDEWVANIDRNAGNILYDGITGYWLIEHAHALTGPNWSAPTLQDSGRSFKNHLLQGHAENTSLHEKYQFRRLANEWAIRHNELSLLDLTRNGALTRLIDTVDAEAVKDFLIERATLVSGLVCLKLGIPELGLADER